MEGVERQCGLCDGTFAVCARCERGQKYCSRPCMQVARREQQRLARRRYQQSLEGRDDHRDRNREYRRKHQNRRENEAAVMDTASEQLARAGSLCLAPIGVDKEIPDEFDASHRDRR